MSHFLVIDAAPSNVRLSSFTYYYQSVIVVFLPDVEWKLIREENFEFHDLQS